MNPALTSPSHDRGAGLGLLAQRDEPAASVEIAGLSLGYRGRPVLQGLDWQMHPGQVIGLLGRNGAGKTTLLEALLGLRDVQAGTVRLFGQPATRLDDAARARIGYVPQASDLFDSRCCWPPLMRPISTSRGTPQRCISASTLAPFQRG